MWKMNWKLPLCTLFSSFLFAVGQYDGSYYNSIDAALTGDAFKSELTTLLNNGTVTLSYKQVYSAFEVIDYKPVDSSCGDIKEIYSRFVLLHE